jgi:CheY-like chemotaxis protein
VAEDNAVNQQLISAIFSNLGHKITMAANGREAIECIKAEVFDFVLMDIRMPVMDGLEATTIIRAMPTDNATIPVIALTADISAGNIQDYLDIGINSVCAKPLDLPVLLKTINKCLGEDIHSSIPNATPSASGLAKTGEDTETQSAGFTDVLERVSAMVDQASATSNENRELPAEMAGIGIDKFTELVLMYEKNLLEQCGKLNTALAAFVSTPDDPDLRASVKALTHSLKGGGGSFGYHLVTTIAAEADLLLKTKESLDADDLRALTYRSEALYLIASKKITGNGGKAGRILLQGLKDCS